jgi:Zn-dependent protease with chaperone function
MQKMEASSIGYRSQAIKAIFAIMFFIAVYLTVLLFSILLVGFLFYEALTIEPGGVGRAFFNIVLFVTAFALLIFIIFFFFRKQTVDRTGWIEITEKAQPKLFEMISSIARQLDVHFPQRVYFSCGVDAMVFYDSNFKNLFFPSKENLVIGLGLINSVSESELKAILAHEFGHFTQRSWNVYSYLYIENQIIYKMLIDEQFYQTLLQKFFQTILGFAWIVVIYSRIIRWILRKAYYFVSKTYMALSREMEFHSDEISAKIAGTVPAVTSLLRSTLAMDSFNYLWQFYFERLSDNIKTENIYPQHYHIIITIANKYGMEIKSDLPHVTKEIINRFNRSKLIIEDQWASHPTIYDRVTRLEELNIHSEISLDSAWNLVTDLEKTQKKLTEKLFRHWNYAEDTVLLSSEEFKEKYDEVAKKYSFSEKYNHFYEYRDISLFDITQTIENKSEDEFKNFNEIYTDANVDLVREFSGLDRDLKTIEAIVKKEFIVENFEYDGVRYKSGESSELFENLIKKHESLHKEINELDIKIFKFFLKLAELSENRNNLIKLYEKYFFLLQQDKENLKVYLDLINAMQFIWQVHSFNQINLKMEELKTKEELFLSKVKLILSDDRYSELIDEDKKTKLDKYISQEWKYFTGTEYDNDALAVLEETVFVFYQVCSGAPFNGLKKILDFQIELLDSKELA